jgi:uncharacterized delta-60 repeat protein
VLVLPDSRILVLGHASRTSFLRRYLPDGRLDRTFGADGTVRVDGIQGGKLLRQDSGRIVVAGGGPNMELRARRYRGDGTLDRSFGTDGLARMRLYGASIDDFDTNAAALGPGGRIYLAGSTFDSDYWRRDGLVAAFTSAGKPATRFSGNGWRTIHVGNIDVLDAIAVAQDGRVVVTGGYFDTYFDSDSDGPGHLLTGVLRSDGRLDPGFGQGGIVVTDIAHGSHPPGRDFAAGRAIVLSDDRLVVAGTSGGTAHADFLAVRYWLNGA